MPLTYLHRKDPPTPNNLCLPLKMGFIQNIETYVKGSNVLPSKTGLRRLKEAAQCKFEACVGFSLSTGHPAC